jgi:hypothetical protein
MECCFVNGDLPCLLLPASRFANPAGASWHKEVCMPVRVCGDLIEKPSSLPDGISIIGVGG